MSEQSKGVFLAKKKDGTIYYRSSITYQKKHISLGSFCDAQSAHQAYLDADYCLNNKNVNLHDYDSSYIIPFEKWVILINFRDNGIYFGTPIYTYTHFFEYYISPVEVLKFDMDHLFFYSSHKIMKRDGHLFVADYGMQLNIRVRHGIRNYSVAGRDYNFLNNDNYDFRSSNLKIINPYIGVTKVESKGKIKYKAMINLPGYYTIGYYNSETEAAIAYNKAIDCLKKKGHTRNYSPNYLADLSPSLYADIYAKIKISDKIINYNT